MDLRSLYSYSEHYRERNEYSIVYQQELIIFGPVSLKIELEDNFDNFSYVSVFLCRI